MTSKLLIAVILFQFVLVSTQIQCWFDVSYEGAKHTATNNLMNCGSTQHYCALYIIPLGPNDDIDDSRVIWNCGYNDCPSVGNFTVNGIHKMCCNTDGCNDHLLG